MDNRPIGVFDSGMGGLTVRAAVEHALPNEALVYFGDGENVPYGPRPKEEIIAFVDEAVGMMIERNNVKMMIIACNAATGAAIEHLRAKYEIPIIGMEPAVKPAAKSTKTGVIGVLATAAAFKGALYQATSAMWKDKVKIIETVGEGFVELVENDRENSEEAFETVRRAVEPMIEAGADRIVLGCTHYPFLEAQIRRAIEEARARWASEGGGRGAEVEIVDSAPATARRAAQLLEEGNLRAAGLLRPGGLAMTSSGGERGMAAGGKRDGSRAEEESAGGEGQAPKHEFLSFAGNEYVERLARKSKKATELARRNATAK